MKEIKEEYGNDAFYIQYGTGVLGGTVSKSWHPCLLYTSRCV